MNVTFDWNEWYFIITTAIPLLLFWPIRGYFPLALVVVIWIYNLALAATVDYFFIATPFHLYYYGDNPTYELSGALYHFFMYPCCSIIFLFMYDKFELYGWKTVWYIAGWSGFSLFFEWLCVQNHALHYTGWKIYYSIPVYPDAAVMLILLFRFTRRKVHELELPRLRV